MPLLAPADGRYLVNVKCQSTNVVGGGLQSSNLVGVIPVASLPTTLVTNNAPSAMIGELFLSDGTIEGPNGSENNIILSSPGAISFTASGNFSGTVAAASFSGDGGGLTGIPSTSITGGITTNIVLSGGTLYVTNGVIMKYQ